MSFLDDAEIKQAAVELKEESEISRRAEAKRISEQYRSGGKRFLHEELVREFTEEGIQEFRLVPLNVLKAIVLKKSMVYKDPPMREANNPGNQKLVDFYTEELDFNGVMQKANKYLNKFSNTQIYTVPTPVVEGERLMKKLKTTVVAPFDYSAVPEMMDRRDARAIIFNSFVQEGRVAPDTEVKAKGKQGFERDRGHTTGTGKSDLVASNEQSTDESNILIWWTDTMHFTTDEKGAKFMKPDMGPEQFLNPFGRIPSTNLTRDRDQEFWSKENMDLPEMSLLFQKALTDLVTMIKTQGFAQLLLTGENEPSTLHLGMSKGVFMKQRPDGPTPTMNYIQAASPIGDINVFLMDLLSMILTTNGLAPQSISGSAGPTSVTSGFQALIQNSDNLQLIQADKPIHRDAEKDHWDVIARVHNWLFDDGSLNDEARKLGRFTDDFSISVSYKDMKPIESEEQRLAQVEKLLDLGLATKFDALKKLDPDLTDKQIEDKLAQIKKEKEENAAAFGLPVGMGTVPARPGEEPPEPPGGSDDEEDEEDDDS